MTHADRSVFIVDADVWIAAHETRYPRDVFPALWTHLQEAVETKGRIRSPRQVLKELGNGKSGISAWARALSGLVLKEPPTVQRRAGEILTAYPNLLHGATHDAADPWLIAHAEAGGCVVVTEEHMSSNPNKPKIPNICRDLNVGCINTIGMFRRLGLKL